MKQYGIKLTRKDKSTISVFFNPLTYMDWCIYSSTSEMYDIASSRYIVSRYVTRAIDNNEDIEPTLILKEDVSIIRSVIDSIINNSIFGEHDKFITIMEELDKKSKTLMGCYDLFIFMKMGPEFYIQMVDQDAYVRAQIIMMIEKSTGINVKDRFEYAVTNNIPLDILSDNDTYAKNIRKHGKPMPQNLRDRQPPLKEHNDYMNNTKPASNDKADLPSNVDNMLQDSRVALQQALSIGKQKRKDAFNFEKDEMNYSKFNTE